MVTAGEGAITMTGGRLLGAAGPLSAGVSVTLRIDSSGLTLVGGDPPTAWQIPFSALREPRCRAHRGMVEVAAWVSGSLVMVTFSAASLEGSTASEIDALLAGATGRDATGPTSGGTPYTVNPRRRRLSLLVVAVLAIGAGASLLVWQLADVQTRSSARADRVVAATMNLRGSDLPAGWSALNSSSSILGGFLSPGSSRQSPAQKRVTAAVISGYQGCMGITNAVDRVFGAAGVTPPIEIGGMPYGPEQSTAVTEVGTVTQRYASPADVAADRRQISQARFPTCFAEAIGRLATANGDVIKATEDLPVVRQEFRQPLGVLVTGANVTIPMAGLAGTSTAQLGITVLLTGSYEQTLYTFAVPGSFPERLRQQVVGELSARLAGVSGTRSA